MTETDGWKEYLTTNLQSPNFMEGAELDTFVQEQTIKIVDSRARARSSREEVIHRVRRFEWLARGARKGPPSEPLLGGSWT